MHRVCLREKGKGTTQQVLNENIEGVYPLGKDVVAVIGLAHLMTNHCMIYKAARGSDEMWTATLWRALPGAPESSWPVDAGELLTDIAYGGSILVSTDGVMRLAPCAASK